MAKQTDKDFKRICREAAKNGLINGAAGNWISAASLSYGLVGQHSQAGYRYGDYDHARKPKEKKTGACRDWPPGTTYKSN